MAPSQDQELFGNLAPFAEPAWCNDLASPYYNESHRRVRDYVRQYLSEHVVPYAEEWEENGHVPDEARKHYARSGLAFQGIPREYSGAVGLPAGISHEDWDIFHSLVVSHEVSRIGYAGVTVGLSGGTSIGIPPIIVHGTEKQKRDWLPGIFTGEISFCLGATEPTGGSDLANLKTTARRTEDGQAYIVNGHKVCRSHTAGL
uniref:Acyl-CoA dehydrogenase/oxidase N-terminal domain-containing protein n=1 Tax=Bionectria ochroleuca TaxID=29856 RepID=A0A8H7TNJ2_BIOOC